MRELPTETPKRLLQGKVGGIRVKDFIGAAAQRHVNSFDMAGKVTGDVSFIGAVHAMERLFSRVRYKMTSEKKLLVVAEKLLVAMWTSGRRSSNILRKTPYFRKPQRF